MTIVRRPDFAGGGITDAEHVEMAKLVAIWTARALRTEPIDHEAITRAIVALYAAAGLPAPRVVIVPSPLVMAVAGGFAAAIWHMRTTAARIATATRAATGAAIAAATHDATRDATYAATDAATYTATRTATVVATDDATHAATDDATRAATDDATRISTDDAIDDATDAATFAATRAATLAATAAATDVATDAATYTATRAATLAATAAATAGWARRLAMQIGGPIELMLACVNSWASCYQGGNMWAAWACYLAAARDVLGLRLPQHEAYAAWEQAARHGGFRFMHAEFCLVSDFPAILRVDAQHRPHCADGPSHRWRDGWSLYHWHGVAVPREWIEERDGVDVRAVLADRNVERRRAGMEIVGWNKALAALHATTVDADPNPEIGTLLRCDLPDAPGSLFLRVRCGTGREFVLPVPEDVKTAAEANAWTYGLTSSQLRTYQVRS